MLQSQGLSDVSLIRVKVFQSDENPTTIEVNSRYREIEIAATPIFLSFFELV